MLDSLNQLVKEKSNQAHAEVIIKIMHHHASMMKDVPNGMSLEEWQNACLRNYVNAKLALHRYKRQSDENGRWSHSKYLTMVNSIKHLRSIYRKSIGKPIGNKFCKMESAIK